MTRSWAGAAPAAGGVSFAPSAINEGHARAAAAMHTADLSLRLVEDLAWGSLSHVQGLLSQGASVDARTPDGGATALILSAYLGRADVVAALLEAGASTTIVSARDGSSALHAACSRGSHSHMLAEPTSLERTRVVRVLLAAGADVNAVTSTTRWSPLHCAVLSASVPVAKLLLDSGAQVDARASRGVRPLHWASSGGHLAMVKLLISRGADRGAANDDGETPLHAASVEGRLECCRALLEGVPLRLKQQMLRAHDGERSTALHFAAAFGRLPVVRLLLDAGADVNALDQERFTALTWACRRGHTNIARLLLSHGANMALGDSVGWTALHHAVEGGHVPVMAALAENCKGLGAPSRRTRHSAPSRADAVVQPTLSWLVNAGDRDGDPPLAVAGCNGRDEALMWLLGANADAGKRNHVGQTPLHHAASGGHGLCVALCLAALGLGEDGSPVEDEDFTLQVNKAMSAHEASLANSAAAGPLILRAGPSPSRALMNAVDDAGYSCLMLAAAAAVPGRQDCAAVVRLLLREGADTGLRRVCDGKTAAELASEPRIRQLIARHRGGGGRAGEGAAKGAAGGAKRKR